MPKSKVDKKRKNKVKDFKRNMSEKNENVGRDMPVNETMNGLAEMREVPKWDPRANLDLMGKEFEILYNGINELGLLLNQAMSVLIGAAQSIMQNNVANRKVTVDFEKLVEENGEATYVPMTEEEMAPHKKQLEDFITKLNEMKETVKAEIQEKKAEEAGIVIPTEQDVANITRKK